MKSNKLSIVIPVYNEEGSIESTILALQDVLDRESVTYEIIVVNDGSTDNTKEILLQLNKRNKKVIIYDNLYCKGFGGAVRFGLDNFEGDIVTIVMGDSSDSPSDVIKFFNEFNSKEVDCVFGNRFDEKGEVVNYPLFKLVMNRLFNRLVSLFVDLKYSDYTNAFKMYKAEVVKNLMPFESNGFSLTLEIPLKAIKNGYSYVVCSNSWINRKAGYSKLSLFKNVQSYFGVLFKYINKTI